MLTFSLSIFDKPGAPAFPKLDTHQSARTFMRAKMSRVSNAVAHKGKTEKVATNAPNRGAGAVRTGPRGLAEHV